MYNIMISVGFEHMRVCRFIRLGANNIDINLNDAYRIKW